MSSVEDPSVHPRRRMRRTAFLLLPRRRIMSRHSLCALLCGLLAFAPLSPSSAHADAPKAEPKKDPPEIAGKSEYLRSVPKHFATLKALDPSKRTVTLLIEGDSLPKVWELTPDAEVKV